MAQGALFYFQDIIYEKKADDKFLKLGVLEILEEVLSELNNAPSFDRNGLETIFAAFLEKHHLKLGKLAQPLRVAFTGTSISPGIFEIMEVLGKEAVLERLSNAIEHIRQKAVSDQHSEG